MRLYARLLGDPVDGWPDSTHPALRAAFYAIASPRDGERGRRGADARALRLLAALWHGHTWLAITEPEKHHRALLDAWPNPRERKRLAAADGELSVHYLAEDSQGKQRRFAFSVSAGELTPGRGRLRAADRAFSPSMILDMHLADLVELLQELIGKHWPNLPVGDRPTRHRRGARGIAEAVASLALFFYGAERKPDALRKALTRGRVRTRRSPTPRA
jgi:hypothetical protein